MRIDEKYKRLIKLLFSTILLSMVVAIYSFVWTGYYNRIIENPFFRRGNWMMIFLYGVLLVFFMQLYGGFKVGYLRKGNLIYSQLLSVALVNIFTYLQIAVLDKHFFSIVPMAVMTVFDFFVIIIWTLVFQLFYQWIFPPRRMLLIAGNRSDYHLLQKMNSREDKYEIKDLISYKKGLNLIFKKVHNFDGVILGDMPSHERNQILKYCFSHNIRTYSVPKISDILMRSSSELTLFDTPMLLSRNDGLTIEQEFCKRTMDVVLSLIGAIITLPFFLVIAICIKATDGGPVFYKQTRLTKDGKEFEIIKFRTMIQPQIYNILKGEMSLVGPRPERPELAAEIEKEIPEFAYRLKVKAGLTGYAQVYGKYNTTFYDKLKQDLVYIRNYSVWLDLKLMIMTPKIMFMKESTEGVQK